MNKMYRYLHWAKIMTEYNIMIIYTIKKMNQKDIYYLRKWNETMEQWHEGTSYLYQRIYWRTSSSAHLPPDAAGEHILHDGHSSLSSVLMSLTVANVSRWQSIYESDCRSKKCLFWWQKSAADHREVQYKEPVKTDW